MIKLKHFFSHINIGKEVIIFGGTEIGKKSQCYKSLYSK